MIWYKAIYYGIIGIVPFLMVRKICSTIIKIMRKKKNE